MGLDAQRRELDAGTVVALDEEPDRNQLIEGLSGVAIFDMDGVRRATSFGIREWISALRDLRVDVRRDQSLVAAGDPPSIQCPYCGGEAEFDELPDEYFGYVRSCPAPVVPQAAPQLIDGTTDPQRRRLRSRKEIAGLVTAVWLSGPLDETARFKRRFDGLRGHVVLE